MNSTSWIRTLLVVGVSASSTASLCAAKPAIEGPQPSPIVTASAPPFSASFLVDDVFDPNSLTEYACQSQGVNTFIDFDFGAPTQITHFHHLNRSAADGITASQSIFSNDPSFATTIATVPITHTSQTAAVNYALGTHTAQFVRWDFTGIRGAATNQGAREIAFLNLTGKYSQIASE